MQTHEWEALLDGTTPGPWTGIADENTTCITTPDGVLIDVDEHWSSCSEADVRLAAHAPAAVAEVIRLRKAIEDAIRSLRAPLCSHMPEGDKLDEYLEEWEMQGYAAHILTRILEGDADE